MTLTTEQVVASREMLLAEGYHPVSKAVCVHDELLALREANDMNTDKAVESIRDLQGECERLRNVAEMALRELTHANSNKGTRAEVAYAIRRAVAPAESDAA